MRLARLLGSMKDDDGRVLVAGYYDEIELSEVERTLLAAVGDDETALRNRLGIARAEKVGGNYQEALQYPSLNVRGMGSAAIGEKVASIIPSEAVAEIDIRTTPEKGGNRCAIATGCSTERCPTGHPPGRRHKEETSCLSIRVAYG